MTHRLLLRLQRVEFETRIFVSFSMALVVCWLSFFVFELSPPNFVLVGSLFRIGPEPSTRVGYGVVAALLVVASLLRMWAGSALSSQRMMAFKVQRDELVTTGPYRLARHPVYLADLVACLGFALCLRPIGVLLPVLLYIHYLMLTGYEERSLREQFGPSYARYTASIARFLPGIGSISRLSAAVREFAISADGFRHNALYLLFIPGFTVSAFTLSIVPALLIGLPAVVDWAVVHTIIGLREKPTGDSDFSARMCKSSAQSRVTAGILYAQCWEDPEIDRAALGIGPDDTVFTITSGGCNALAFLVDDPRRVIALDLSPYQNHVLDLKMAAFRALTYTELLGFLGVEPSARRLELYRQLRPYLQAESRDYWDRQHAKLNRGVIHCGRYESFLQLTQRWFCRLLGGRELAKQLLAARNRTERERLYVERWDNWRWRLFTRILLSRTVQSLLFDPAFFAQLDESFSFGDHFRERVRRAVVDLPLADNPFFCYILFGGYRGVRSLPTYLRRENFELIRSRLDRIETAVGACEAYLLTLPEGSISKFNFTNIFEWMTPQSFGALLRETIRVGCDGAVLTYRNLLVQRSRPESLRHSLIPDRELARQLHERDRSFIYRAYVVERVRKS
jgi:S-adenosylmethionine-diacylglycerol 3-amino-3-carboxypropyl transferase